LIDVRLSAWRRRNGRCLVVKPLIVEGEFGNGGRLLLVVVVERRWLILLVRVNYFGASCCFWGCHSAATSMEE